MTPSPTERGADLVLAILAIGFLAALALSLAGMVEPFHPSPTPGAGPVWEELQQ